MTEILIRSGRCKLKWHDIDTFVDIPIKDFTKLSNLMFSDPFTNEDVIRTVGDRLISQLAVLDSENLNIDDMHRSLLEAQSARSVLGNNPWSQAQKRPNKKSG